MEKKIIAAFDFDGTITKKDTFIEFIKFSKGRFKLFTGLFLFSPLLILMKLKLYPNWKVKQKLFSYFYKGISINQFNKWGADFSALIDKMLLSKAIDSINLHKNKGEILVIISASIENWIKPWANQTGINTILSTKIEVDINERITGKFLTNNCRGKEKVIRLLEEFPNRNDYYLIAYGNDKGDKELIEFADEGYYNKFI